MEISEIKELKIVDIVNASSPSVRLSNCINEAAKKNTLPFETMGGFIEVRGDARKKVQNLKSLGQKTADEFIRIIENTLSERIPELLEREKREDVNPEILELKIVDIVNASSPSVRLSNCINEAARENALPFETVGEFLEIRDDAGRKIRSVANLGKKTGNELIAIIEKALLGKLPTPTDRKKRIDDPEVRNLRVLDLVNKAITSEQLSRGIYLAAKENDLRFETVGEILDAGEEARFELAKMKNLSRSTADEFLKLVKLHILGNLPESPQHQKRIDLVESIANEYPGVFDPLLEDDVATGVENRVKLEFLEEKIQDLTSDKTHHAEMVWFHFSGETLQTIGDNYGLTRERVRQIINKYKGYITDIESKVWAKKSIYYLIKNNGEIDRLPEKI